MKPSIFILPGAVLLLLGARLANAQTGTISGTIFEDPNYGGGSGRSMAAANGTGVGTAGAAATAATVELYTSAGAYVKNTTTSTTAGSLGTYSFGSLAAGNYIVRVVNPTVNSTRPGTTTGLLPVQTFRTTNGTADTERVGGESPELADAGVYASPFGKPVVNRG